MNFNVDKVSIIRFLNGEMSLKERKELVKWILEGERNLKYFNDIKAVYEAVHNELNSIAGTNKEWERFLKRIERERRKKTNWLGVITKAAAILLLPVMALGLSFYFNASTLEKGLQAEKLVVITPKGQKSKVILPDSTVVWLNSGTQLSYSNFNKEGSRHVRLEGEGYFEVTKDAEHPFIVSTKDYDVKVLGTKFNVRSYNGDENTQTALAEGKVLLLFTDGRSFYLKPGQVAMASNIGKVKVKRTNTNNIICWKNNVLRFDNTSVKDIVPRLEHWYGVKIYVRNMKKNVDKRYTMTIKTESLKETLQLMKYVTPLKYSINGDKVELEFLD